MKKLIIKIKNYLHLRGTYNWALKQMKEGAFIKSDNLKCGYMLFYDYEYNSVMVGVGSFNILITAFVFADECLYKLQNIDSFYVTATKKITLKGTPIVRNIEASFKDYYTVTRDSFVK